MQGVGIRVISDTQISYLRIVTIRADKKCNCRKPMRVVFIAISVYFNFINGLSGIPYDKLKQPGCGVAALFSKKAWFLY